jgi:hypothetical protein
MLHGISMPILSASLAPTIAVATPSDRNGSAMSNLENRGPVWLNLSMSTPLSTNDTPFHDENANTSGLVDVICGKDSRAKTISESRVLENIVGAELSDITKPSSPENDDGALCNPDRTDVVAVNMSMASAMTTITLGRIRSMAPPP